MEFSVSLATAGLYVCEVAPAIQHGQRGIKWAGRNIREVMLQ